MMHYAQPQLTLDKLIHPRNSTLKNTQVIPVPNTFYMNIHPPYLLPHNIPIFKNLLMLTDQFQILFIQFTGIDPNQFQILFIQFTGIDPTQNLS